MTVSFTAGNQAVAAKASDIGTSALLEAGILAAGQDMGADNAAWLLEKLQRLIDSWNARRELIFAITFSQFTLTANHAPHTIGPSGDFNVPIRPVRIASAAFILSSGSNPVDVPIRIRDKDWWAALPLKSQTSSICTHLYYAPAEPLGEANFWPISTAANPVRLELWSSIPQALALDTVLALPQGYWEAIITTLAISLCPSFKQPVPPDLREANRIAMAAILANNNDPPRIDTNGGMPNARPTGIPDFDFLSGLNDNWS